MADIMRKSLRIMSAIYRDKSLYMADCTFRIFKRFCHCQSMGIFGSKNLNDIWFLTSYNILKTFFKNTIIFCWILIPCRKTIINIFINFYFVNIFIIWKNNTNFQRLFF